MESYTVLIPSKGRAGKVTTHQLFKDPVIVCPASEVKAYKEHHPEVMSVPDDVRGITSTRNWILDNVNCEFQIQVDDDARSFHKHEHGKLIYFTDQARIDKLITTMFEMAVGWGLKLWGFSMASDYKFYREFAPFSTQSVAVANIFGIIRNPLRFDERLRVKEDYDYSMQHIFRYRGVLRNVKYGIDVEHLQNEGGCVSYRTKEVELEAYRILLRKWGRKIVRAQDNKNFLKMASPLKGI